MNGWQEPKDGKRIYIITDNTKMDGFTDYIKSEDVERLYNPGKIKMLLTEIKNLAVGVSGSLIASGIVAKIPDLF